jgi:hypothetical protein
MSQYTRKAQVLFTPEQYDAIAQEARRQGKAVGVIIRETVERGLIIDIRNERMRQALAALLAMGQEQAAGTEPEWDLIEKQIAKGALGEQSTP